MGPSGDGIADVETSGSDLGSGEILSDASGYGVQPDDGQIPAIVRLTEFEDEQKAIDEDTAASEEPSVSGALSELHQAVSSKLQSWNPYYRPGGLSKASKASYDKGVKGKKRPVNGTVTTSLGEYVKDGINEDERLGARTRIGKCTILFNGNSFWERAIKTHERHDKLHGYRLHVLRQSIMDDVWSKPAYILSLLLRELAKPESERLEWLFWIDADTIILNPHIPIETFLPPPGSEFDDINLMYSADWNGLNNGVFPVRVNQWSVQLFSAITSYRHFRPDDKLIFRDQSAMNTLMQEPQFAKHLVQAPQRWFNAYQGEHNETLSPYQIRRGDLLVHFAGVPDREHRMGIWLDRAEQHLDDWEIPVRSTSYPQEARDFWDQQRDARKNMKSNLAEIRTKATELLTKTDQRMNEYGDRLSDDEKKAISEQREHLREYVEDPKWQDDSSKTEEATRTLTEVSAPLMKAIAEANKILLHAAHEAIFAGEKDLLDGGYGTGVATPELQTISEAVKSLKNLVMSPEEFWSRQDISSATNNVNVARAKLQQQVAVSAEKAKALEEARKMVDADAAGKASTTEGGTSSTPSAETATSSTAAPVNVQTQDNAVHAVVTEAVISVVMQTIVAPALTVTPEAVMVFATTTLTQDSAPVATVGSNEDLLG